MIEHNVNFVIESYNPLEVAKLFSQSKYVFLFLLTTIWSCDAGQVLLHGIPDTEDLYRFPYFTIQPSSRPFHFKDGKQDAPELCVVGNDGHETDLDGFMEATNSLAFLVIHKDSILYEHYREDLKDSLLSPVFSLAKSFTSTLVGCAIRDGYIQSVDQLVTDFIPELDRGYFKQLTIKHLLQMRTGIDTPESKTYFSRDLEQLIVNLKMTRPPGDKFEYWSINAQILGLVLERAIAPMSMQEYLHQNLWEPLGMEHKAMWSYDSEETKHVKTFCCINATARDLAKLGRLYLHKGNWEGKQLLPKKWVEDALSLPEIDGKKIPYGYQWWLYKDGPDFLAKGFRGQYIYVHPEKDVIVVRLGHNWGGMHPNGWNWIFTQLAWQL